MIHEWNCIPPETTTKANPVDFVGEIRRNFALRVKRELVGPILVAILLSTGRAPPQGLVASKILAYYQFFYD